MNYYAIGSWVVSVEHVLYSILDVIVWVWWLYLLLFIIKSLISKKELDRKKRNIIAVKCVVGWVYGYLGLLFLKMIDKLIGQNTYLSWFSMHGIILIMILISFGIFLFYSGSFSIYFQERVNYSWPLSFLNKKENTDSPSSS